MQSFDYGKKKRGRRKKKGKKEIERIKRRRNWVFCLIKRERKKGEKREKREERGEKEANQEKSE